MGLFEKKGSLGNHYNNGYSSQLVLTESNEPAKNRLTEIYCCKVLGLLQISCLALFMANPGYADLVNPSNLQTKKGATSAKPLEVLKTKDQMGNADNPNKYLEFVPTTTGYNGIFKFILPSNSSQTLKSLAIRANYRGLKATDQKWSFKLLDAQSGKWVVVADNSTVNPWAWTAISKAVIGDPNRFVNSSSQISLQYITGNNKDTSQLDYLALVTTANIPVTSPPPPTIPAPIPAPTSTQGSRWQPAIGIDWQIQYTGTVDTSLNVDAYNLDLFDTSESVIAGLHAKGKHVICYFSAGSYENWRPDASKFPAAVLGRDLDGWAGEKWLDVSQLNSLIPIMQTRMQMAANKGCDAVDPDNVDGYSNNTGFALGYNDQIAYNVALAQEAHKLGLAISLKNDLDQIKDLVGYFDFAVNEECFQYNECNMLKPFVDAGKPVMGIEYNLATASFCPQANAVNLDFLKKNLSLDVARTACR